MNYIPPPSEPGEGYRFASCEQGDTPLTDGIQIWDSTIGLWTFCCGTIQPQNTYRAKSAEDVAHRRMQKSQEAHRKSLDDRAALAGLALVAAFKFGAACLRVASTRQRMNCDVFVWGNTYDDEL